ncbi:MAG: flavin reductase family protein [Tepidiformaceae bacterium]
MTYPGSQFPDIPGSPREVPPVEKAMLAMSYGVHVIGSTNGAGELNAMLADWVMQVSFTPRLVCVAIENDATTLRNIRETNVFSVNMLHEKDGDRIARQVVMPHEGSKIRGRSEDAAAARHDKMRGLRHTLSPSGCPLLSDALGWYTLDVQQLVTAGDHTLVVGLVTDGDRTRPGEMLIERDLGWEYGG